MNLDDLIDHLIDLRDRQRTDGSTPVTVSYVTRRDGETLLHIERLRRDPFDVKLIVTL